MKSMNLFQLALAALTLSLSIGSQASECGFNIRDWTPESGTLNYTVDAVGKSKLDHGRGISVGDTLALTPTAYPNKPSIDMKLQNFKIDMLNGGVGYLELPKKFMFRFREESGPYKDYDGRRLLMTGGLRVVDAKCGQDGKVDSATVQLFDDYMAVLGEPEVDVFQDAISLVRSARAPK